MLRTKNSAITPNDNDNRNGGDGRGFTSFGSNLQAQRFYDSA
jgi:hypothetical protein